MPALYLREKSAVVGWSLQNLWNFVVSFVVPYLLNDDYAGLHSKVGFIFGAICFLGVVWAWFCFPELKGRSLEEIDEMFLAKLPTRKFRGKRMDSSPFFAYQHDADFSSGYESTFATPGQQLREVENHAARPSAEAVRLDTEKSPVMIDTRTST